MNQVSSPRGFSPVIKIILTAAIVASFASLLRAQSSETTPPEVVTTTAPAVAPSTEVFQTKIMRARALIAAHQLDTAASELESVRAATQDYALRNVTSVMLMSVYLEEGNYLRAEALLEETFKSRSSKTEDSIRTYFALAGQAINGARAHLARYRSFGVSTSDLSLPVEAANDLTKLRSLLERMIAQAREITAARRAYDSLSLLEDVLGLRLTLATDSEDQSKWQAEYASAREVLASSQTEVASLGFGSPLPKNAVRTTVPAANANARKSPTLDLAHSPAGSIAADNGNTAASQIQSSQSAVDNNPAKDNASPELVNNGSLNGKATKKVLPRYPQLAKLRGDAGLVRVYVVVNEKGKVAGIFRSEGPVSLRLAAEEAARQWFFEVGPADGKPTRILGYIDFNFTL